MCDTDSFYRERQAELQNGAQPGSTPVETHELAPHIHPRVSTLSLFGYLATTYAWILEFKLVLLQVLGNNRLGTSAHAWLMTLSISLTVFAYVRGKHDFKRLRHTRGRVQLTGLQAVLVTLFMVSLGAMLSVILDL